jgi:hypothetical protein
VVLGALVVVVDVCGSDDTDGLVVVVDELDELPQAARADPSTINTSAIPRP